MATVIPARGLPATADPQSDSMGNVCRFLSKEDVANAIGVPIVSANPTGDGGCEYRAKGTQADMTAKHMSAMMATRGENKQTQDMVQKVAGGFFNAVANEKKPANEGEGTVPVFVFSVDGNSARAQLHLNASGLGRLGATEALDGIGDEAINSADSMLIFRKGDKLVRIMYMTCPCGVEAVKPLARQIASAL